MESVKLWFSNVAASKVQASNDGDDGDSDDGSDVEDFDFDEGDVGSSKPRKRKVTLTDSGGSEYSLLSRKFLWPYEWLTCTVQHRDDYRGGRGFALTRGYFEVLRYDLDGDGGLGAVDLFLSSVGEEAEDMPTRDVIMEDDGDGFHNHDDVDDSERLPTSGEAEDMLEKFGAAKLDVVNFLRQHQDHLPRPPRLENLLHLLRWIASARDHDLRRAAAAVLGLLPASRAGALLHLFEAAPRFAQEAAALFPRKINGILDKMKPPRACSVKQELQQGQKWRTGLAEALERIAVNHPIRLAFSAILLKETAVPNLEVTLGPFRRASFYRGLPKVQKHAAHVYSYFKDIVGKHGHTGFGYWHLIDYWNEKYGKGNAYKATPIDGDDIRKAVKWLQDHSVIHHDFGRSPRGALEDRFTLDRYQRAMEGIIGIFGKIFREDLGRRLGHDGEGEWTDEDVNEILGNMPNLEQIASDREQLEAAKAIIRNPLTIISGRGGTGKTQVLWLTEAVERQNAKLFRLQDLQQLSMIITGHGLLKRHLRHWKEVPDYSCALCGEDWEYSWHLWEYCPSLHENRTKSRWLIKNGLSFEKALLRFFQDHKIQDLIASNEAKFGL